MIDFDHVTITYPDAPSPTLVDVDWHVDEGTFALVAGRTGSGKSTLLGAINGHVPHFTGGHVQGRVTIDGRDTATHPPRDLARTVGRVHQDPLSGFVADTVEEELAYGMEQLGIAPAVMRTRVEETLDLLGIANLRSRAPRTLSGGQQQRVAIGSVLASGARVLVLDEPTSALDPTSAEEVLASLLRLVHDLGVTAVVAEHRLERVIEYADVMVLVGQDGHVESGPPADMILRSPLRPPVVDLAQLAGWTPPPLSVRDARRRAVPLRERLATCQPGAATPAADSQVGSGTTAAPARLDVAHVTVAYGATTAVRDVSFTLTGGMVAALMGRNGSGKSSLLWALTGVGARQAGTWAVSGRDLTTADVGAVRDAIRLIPQTAADLLYLNTVQAECAAADKANGVPPGTARALLDTLAPGIDPAAHPRDLSEGQRLCLVLALQVTAHPAVLLLDEPTRGLDDVAKGRLAQVLTGLTEQGKAVLVATHDVEFVARLARRVLVMAGGDLIADGSTEDILAGSSAMAPQVAKVLAPQRWLTVAQVAAALGWRHDRTAARVPDRDTGHDGAGGDAMTALMPDRHTPPSASPSTTRRRGPAPSGDPTPPRSPATPSGHPTPLPSSAATSGHPPTLRSRAAKSGRPRTPRSPARVRAIPVSGKTALVLALASIGGLAAFFWPLFLPAAATTAQHSADAPFIFLALIPLLIVVVLAQLADGGLDAKALALLGVLSAVEALARPLGAGVNGFETMGFLLIVAGRVFGPGFGFTLGCTSLFASALLTAGVGPWLPFQMLACGWIGLGAGLLPDRWFGRRLRGWRELALLVAYGVVSAYVFGALMTTWFWPFVAGSSLGDTAALAYVPGGPLLDNLHRLASFVFITSTVVWDTGRAVTDTVLLTVLGPAVLTILRRAVRRARFDADATFD